MPVPPRRRALAARAAAGVLALTGAYAGAPAQASSSASTQAVRAGDDATPLTVRLTTMSPATIPRSGPIRIQGVVRNDSDEQWDDINVQAFVSETPITSAGELAKAADTDEEADVGDRLTDDFVSVGGLAPGRTAAFTLTLPRADLPVSGEPGVYWIGAHALGTSEEGRDQVADGRARTFAPLLPARQRATDVSVVVPFRAKVRRGLDGALRNPDSWRALLRPTGRLGRILGVAGRSGADPVTLLVDPAVLDAARTAGAGPRDPGRSAPEASPSASPSADASADPDEAQDQKGQQEAERRAPGAAQARAWLRRFRALTASTSVRTLGLAYADPDVAGLGHRSRELLGTAYTLGRSTFDGYDVTAQPAAAPPDGYLPGDVLDALGTDVAVLLGDQGSDLRRRSWRSTAGQQLVFADSRTAEGGPGPTSSTDALAMRQRIVSAAALRAIEGRRSPLVVVLPPAWDPGASWQAADFFGGMDLPWLRLTGLPPDDAGAPVRDRLAYPAKARDSELTQTLVDAAKRVITAAGVYADALVAPEGTVEGITRLALQATSYYARADPGGAQADADDVTRSIQGRLQGIRLSVGSPQVTMSGGSGVIVVTVINDLQRRVQVGLQARTDSTDLRIRAHDPVTLPAGQRTTVRLEASSSQIGVHQVTLSPVTEQGDQVGTPLAVSVRSSQVGVLIWAVMGAAGALLVVMIVRRWVRRGLRRRSPAQ